MSIAEFQFLIVEGGCLGSGSMVAIWRYAHTFFVMATMTIRTTVAFDPATVARWERLTKRWGVSKSEALRRALEAADAGGPEGDSVGPDLSDETIAAMSPQEAFQWLQDHPTGPPGWGEAFQEELREARDRDAEIEEERERERNLQTKLTRGRGQ